MNREKDLNEEFNRRYEKWQSAVHAVSQYSKSTAYTGLPEYRGLIALGREALPLLFGKLEQDEGMDFLLAEGIIAIEGWDPSGFPQTDLRERRSAVLRKRLNARREDE